MHELLWKCAFAINVVFLFLNLHDTPLFESLVDEDFEVLVHVIHTEFVDTGTRKRVKILAFDVCVREITYLFTSLM